MQSIQCGQLTVNDYLQHLDYYQTAGDNFQLFLTKFNNSKDQKQISINNILEQNGIKEDQNLITLYNFVKSKNQKKSKQDLQNKIQSSIQGFAKDQKKQIIQIEGNIKVEVNHYCYQEETSQIFNLHQLIKLYLKQNYKDKQTKIKLIRQQKESSQKYRIVFNIGVKDVLGQYVYHPFLQLCDILYIPNHDYTIDQVDLTKTLDQDFIEIECKLTQNVEITMKSAIEMSLQEFLDSIEDFSEETKNLIIKYLKDNDIQDVSSLQNIFNSLQENQLTQLTIGAISLIQSAFKNLGSGYKRKILGFSHFTSDQISTGKVVDSQLHQLKILFATQTSRKEDFLLNYPIFNKKAIDRCLQNLEDKIDSSSFQRLRDFLLLFNSNLKQINDISKGMIFYGPPGTGKTFIIHEVAQYSGLSEIVEMKSGTNFIKSHFGMVQLDFEALHSRCDLIPHLACCLIIDQGEIFQDRMAPSKDNGGNVEIVNTFLANIGGLQSIPNLFVFIATNFQQVMDSALLSRLSFHVFVGLPAQKQREIFLQQKLAFNISNFKFEKVVNFLKTQQLAEYLSTMTTNFSKRDLGFLSKMLTEKFQNHSYKNNANFNLHDESIMAIINRELENAINQMQMSAQIFSKQVLKAQSSKKNFKLKEFNSFQQFFKSKIEEGKYPSQRIIIDLASSAMTMQFQMYNKNIQKMPATADQNKKNFEIIECKLQPINKQVSQPLPDMDDYISILADFVGSQKIEIIKVINQASLSFITQQNKENYLKNMQQQFQSSQSAMLVIDLEILGLSLSEPNLQNNAPKNPSSKILEEDIQNQEIKSLITEMFSIPSISSLESLDRNFQWVVMIGRFKGVLKRIEKQVQWPESNTRTVQIEKFKTQNEKWCCVQCGEFSNEQENKNFSTPCQYHPGIFFNSYDNSYVQGFEGLEKTKIVANFQRIIIQQLVKKQIYCQELIDLELYDFYCINCHVGIIYENGLDQPCQSGLHERQLKNYIKNSQIYMKNFQENQMQQLVNYTRIRFENIPIDVKKQIDELNPENLKQWQCVFCFEFTSDFKNQYQPTPCKFHGGIFFCVYDKSLFIDLKQGKLKFQAELNLKQQQALIKYPQRQKYLDFVCSLCGIGALFGNAKDNPCVSMPKHSKNIQDLQKMHDNAKLEMQKGQFQKLQQQIDQIYKNKELRFQKWQCVRCDEFTNDVQMDDNESTCLYHCGYFYDSKGGKMDIDISQQNAPLFISNYLREFQLYEDGNRQIIDQQFTNVYDLYCQYCLGGICKNGYDSRPCQTGIHEQNKYQFDKERHNIGFPPKLKQNLDEYTQKIHEQKKLTILRQYDQENNEMMKRWTCAICEQQTSDFDVKYGQNCCSYHQGGFFCNQNYEIQQDLIGKTEILSYFKQLMRQFNEHQELTQLIDIYCTKCGIGLFNQNGIDNPCVQNGTHLQNQNDKLAMKILKLKEESVQIFGSEKALMDEITKSYQQKIDWTEQKFQKELDEHNESLKQFWTCVACGQTTNDYKQKYQPTSCCYHEGQLYCPINDQKYPLFGAVQIKQKIFMLLDKLKDKYWGQLESQEIQKISFHCTSCFNEVLQEDNSIDNQCMTEGKHIKQYDSLVKKIYSQLENQINLEGQSSPIRKSISQLVKQKIQRKKKWFCARCDTSMTDQTNMQIETVCTFHRGNFFNSQNQKILEFNGTKNSFYPFQDDQFKKMQYQNNSQLQHQEITQIYDLYCTCCTIGMRQGAQQNCIINGQHQKDKQNVFQERKMFDSQFNKDEILRNQQSILEKTYEMKKIQRQYDQLNKEMIKPWKCVACGQQTNDFREQYHQSSLCKFHLGYFYSPANKTYYKQNQYLGHEIFNKQDYLIGEIDKFIEGQQEFKAVEDWQDINDLFCSNCGSSFKNNFDRYCSTDGRHIQQQDILLKQIVENLQKEKRIPQIDKNFDLKIENKTRWNCARCNQSVSNEMIAQKDSNICFFHSGHLYNSKSKKILLLKEIGKLQLIKSVEDAVQLFNSPQTNRFPLDEETKIYDIYCTQCSQRLKEGQKQCIGMEHEKQIEAVNEIRNQSLKQFERYSKKIIETNDPDLLRTIQNNYDLKKLEDAKNPILNQLQPCKWCQEITSRFKIQYQFTVCQAHKGPYKYTNLVGQISQVKRPWIWVKQFIKDLYIQEQKEYYLQTQTFDCKACKFKFAGKKGDTFDCRPLPQRHQID